MIGKTYAIPPQPPVPENLITFAAGNLSIGVEYRDVDPEGLVATYRDNPAHLAELVARSPEGGFTDEGVSLHVFDAADGHEYLRFDVFDADPHYHYNHHGPLVRNNVIEFDVIAHGEMLPWALDRIRTRMPEMLTEAGGTHLVTGLDQLAIDQALDQVAEIAERAQATTRAVQRARGGSTDDRAL
jgi:hypothetical protein